MMISPARIRRKAGDSAQVKGNPGDPEPAEMVDDSEMTSCPVTEMQSQGNPGSHRWITVELGHKENPENPAL